MSDSSAVRRALADRLAGVVDRVAAATVASGRPAGAVTLVAVTKYMPVAWARALVEAGCRDLGESRPQELWSKAAELADPAIRWHFIGHMQRNKLRRSLPVISLFHSVDSQRLLAALDEEAAAAGRVVPALLEVNISGDANKTGFTAAEIAPLVDRLGDFAHVRIDGLMGMSGLEHSEAEAERDFERLRTLRDELVGRLPAGAAWPHLSMGMSGDFEAAIRQGATLVRIGSALTEGLRDSDG
ncbi:MAG TPA: YggS family pyridoxal phosphate-dependent enzyme [Pirellulales bacterium]|nr:YggS family pyridoxal phosphate-dependent enzyme [Pirellulales bacterium]